MNISQLAKLSIAELDAYAQTTKRAHERVVRDYSPDMIPEDEYDAIIGALSILRGQVAAALRHRAAQSLPTTDEADDRA